MKELAIKKLYYSISEVSRITAIKPYVLRYWETEFPELHPSKNRAGKRIYRRADVQLVLLIKKLLYSDKFTIEGARNRIRSMNENGSSDRKEQLLAELRTDLNDLLEFLDT